MDLSLFQIVNYTLILILVILFGRYFWIVFVLHDDEPVQWQRAVNERSLPPGLKRMKRRYSDKIRFFNWWIQVGRLKREQVPGVFVELGVYKGDSARVIHRMDRDRPLHLFDTFTGFPAGDLHGETGEAATYTPENFADTDIAAVMSRIGDEHNIIIHQGYFPDSAADFREPVALANIDADLYMPTRAGLERFYPLLSPGGVILVHDYNHKWPGVMQAVDEFVRTIPEAMILLPDTAGTAMIIRNKEF
jgi:O-methyltransferase